MTTLAFPLHDLAYARGLAHLGEAVQPDDLGLPVLRRPIPGTEWYDGMLPPPYVAPTPDEVATLATALPDLVSIVGVIRPGSEHPWSGVPGVAPAKQHYVFDPQLPWRPGTRTRRHLTEGERRWRLEMPSGAAVAGTAATLHAQVAAARGFSGSLSAFPAAHFDQLAQAPWGVFFAAVDPRGHIGAMACGALCHSELHLLHIAGSAQGRRTSASYVLMAGITEWCTDAGRRMYLGSQPRTGTPGLARFKARWTNTLEPSHLVRLIVRPAEYQSLGGIPGNPDTFFPAYRTPG